jgi:hypothetical protein
LKKAVREKIAINPDKFDKLIMALRTAVDNDGTLDKEATSYNDIDVSMHFSFLSIVTSFEVLPFEDNSSSELSK